MSASTTSRAFDPEDPDTRAALLAELDALFEELTSELAGDVHLCRMSGVCCDFLRCDHVLYATALEAWYTVNRSGDPSPADEPRLCPYWKKGMCTAREGRPVGCRTYFCAAERREERDRIYESFHARIASVGNRYGFPYEYAPFVELLAESRDED